MFTNHITSYSKRLYFKSVSYQIFRIHFAIISWYHVLKYLILKVFHILYPFCCYQILIDWYLERLWYVGTRSTSCTQRHETAKVCAGLDQLAVKHDISQNSVHIDRVVQQLAVIRRGRFPPAFQFYMFCKISGTDEFLKTLQILNDHCRLTLVGIWGDTAKQLHFTTHQCQNSLQIQTYLQWCLLAVVCDNDTHIKSYFSI